ncbi:ABC transporter substrate-binding protein [Chenggangzhangella methanolivorans]|uniref:ABC transporter substrate-binding protein n=1 Tax=Chenggangzhangella methanolivorans TaxID=1437009 RepID=A0A9E6UP24_9HYPH|nr:ABC transporter substrate-binding protein [Chenggangzhangella methanolivorans]QZO00934.1 ABC transporter substrate-binding protein [Chenggangzhangella methanolivorans]
MGRLGLGFICVAGALAAGVAGLVAMGAGRAAIPPDTLVIGQLAEPKSLDPATVTAVNDFRILVNVFEGLTRYRPGTLEVGPGLAERWEILDGGKTYVFHLKPGVRFHDGTPFDADAVKFNLDRMLDPKHPAAGTGPFPLSFFFKPVREVIVVDPLTIKLRLEAPYAPLLSNLAYPAGLMVSPTAVTKLGRGFARAPVGTGPFRFAGWESERQVRLEANREHRDGAPKIDALVFRPIADANARLSEMLAGGLDVMPELPADSVAAFRGDPRFRLAEAAGPHLWFLILNVREGPTKDVRVRRAISLAIDRETLVHDVLQGTATAPAGPISEAFGPASDPAVTPYPHDPEKARALIREAGAEGARVTLLAAEGGSGMLEPIAMATAIQSDLRRVGLDARVETFEWNAYLARVNGGLKDAAMAEMAWMTNDPDTLPSLALKGSATPDKGGFNAGYYENPELDRLLDEARAEQDPKARAALYRRVDRLVHDDAPWAFVASWKQDAAVSASVQGFELQPSFLMDLRMVNKK